MATTSGVKTFLQRRDRLLTVIGAIIVFSTFLVREAAREHLKEVADSIRGAENAYRLATNTELSLQGDSYFTGEDDMKEILKQMNTGTDDQRLRAGVEAMAKALPVVPKFLGLFEYDLEALVAVANVLDKNDGFKTRISAQSKRLEQLKTFYKGLPHMTTKEILDKKNQDKVAYEMSSFGTIIETVTAFAKEVYPLHDDVLIEAARQEKVADRWFKRCTWASYFLYTLGWSLGLIGKVYGVGGAAG